ncbi:MAG TPA: hypothetical protein VE800_06525 [Actinomycetota bacterium]|jgi:hypothetical protein|nr:hypothetical protein [Actinomycetota bacterium]
MLLFLATAHTWRGGDGPFTVAPIVGLVVTLLLIRTILRLPLGPAAVGASAVLGTLFASLGARWGYTLILLSWVVAIALFASIRRAGPFRRNISD